MSLSFSRCVYAEAGAAAAVDSSIGSPFEPVSFCLNCCCLQVASFAADVIVTTTTTTAAVVVVVVDDEQRLTLHLVSTTLVRPCFPTESQLSCCDCDCDCYCCHCRVAGECSIFFLNFVANFFPLSFLSLSSFLFSFLFAHYTSRLTVVAVSESTFTFSAGLGPLQVFFVVFSFSKAFLVSPLSNSLRSLYTEMIWLVSPQSQ